MKLIRVIRNDAKKAFNIPTFLDSLKRSIERKEMTYEEAAKELYRGGYFNYVPGKSEVKKKLGLK